jgi:hypothetical protein
VRGSACTSKTQVALLVQVSRKRLDTGLESRGGGQLWKCESILGSRSLKGETLVPTVDPADVKAAWKVYRDLGAPSANKQVAIASFAFEQVCSPRAHIRAACHRAIMLRFLFLSVDHSPEEPEAKELAQYCHDGELDERVFHVMSQIPLRWIPKEGLPGFPFNGEEFLKQLREVV